MVNRYLDDECICENKGSLIIDELTKSRTLLRCYNCRGIVCWWDSETEEEQEKRISNYYNRKHDNQAPIVWTTEQLDSLHKKSFNSLEELV